LQVSVCHHTTSSSAVACRSNYTKSVVKNAPYGVIFCIPDKELGAILPSVDRNQ
jgi:hypothetical protein